MRNYTETYEYDVVGNFKRLHHFADNGQGTWQRSYEYLEPSLIPEAAAVGVRSNRLSRTTVSGQGLPSTVEPYQHDDHGNMIAMPHLRVMEWDFEDQLRATQRHVVNDTPGEKTCYVYDATGQRARKVTDRGNGPRYERLYLGALEIYREYAPTGDLSLERETLHIRDDTQDVALVETKTLDVQSPVTSHESLVRYQFGNHLGSASLELNETAQIISYEEYYPYGSTSYAAVRSDVEVSTKSYRYTGKERETETGLYYHGARYYACWLGRWTSADPAQLVDGLNAYHYVKNSPTRYFDANRLWGTDMHFGAVYVAGRLQGASHAEALHAAIASQAMDDYGNLAAPSVKARAAAFQNEEIAPPANYGVYKGLPVFPSRLLPPNGRFLGSFASPQELNRFANNAHALGVTRAQSEEVARRGIKTGNVILFGLGLHTVGDFLPHANTTRYAAFGHQFGLNEDRSESTSMSGSADETHRNPREALATFVRFVQLWSAFIESCINKGKHHPRVQGGSEA